jgi:hypothetical protein
MAPFFFSPGGGGMSKLNWLESFIQSPNPDSIVVDLKLSTAAGISARFPWIMPAATVLGPPSAEGRKLIRLVDGGYFENSGADTAADLIRAIRPHLDPRKVRVIMIMLTGFDGELFDVHTDDETALGELLSPVRTLLSTRQARADLTVLRTADYLCPDLTNCSTGSDFRGPLPKRDWHYKAQWVFAGLNLKDYALPLSWHLSGYTRRFIGLHSGRPSECGNSSHAAVPIWTELNEPKFKGMRILGAMNAANCAASVICGQLASGKVKFPDNGMMEIEDYCKPLDGSSELSAGENASPANPPPPRQ